MNSKLRHLTHKYDDGITEEYVSLGYVYRRYSRNSVNREEGKIEQFATMHYMDQRPLYKCQK